MLSISKTDCCADRSVLAYQEDLGTLNMIDDVTSAGYKEHIKYVNMGDQDEQRLRSVCVLT